MQGRPLPPKQRPDWVNAAALQAALKGSSATAHLQAAAEQERRLALSVALAKEQVALGVDPNAGALAAAKAGEAARAEVQQVLHVAHKLTQQHEGLAQAVDEARDQLKQQQVGRACVQCYACFYLFCSLHLRDALHI